ncbi:hypothetical protein [Parabacteroides sp. PF5-9]|uniref:hypothetical protein n=1 Tax=Parabacteroides sp. PF5-9 TaxID=1742404 RepID=UPI002475ABE1|nr:hypothetical protein [Parabacteroides sp. PF5-9]MDH6358924.1 hypothetical protein [Parabacteroides sp. PF5-9]
MKILTLLQRKFSEAVATRPKVVIKVMFCFLMLCTGIVIYRTVNIHKNGYTSTPVELEPSLYDVPTEIKSRNSIASDIVDIIELTNIKRELDNFAEGTIDSLRLEEINNQLDMKRK